MEKKEIKEVGKGYRSRRLKRNGLLVGKFIFEFSVMVILFGVGVLFMVAFGG